MSLLLFQNKEESPDKHLLDDSQRYKTAEIVNGVLLKRQKLNDRMYHPLIVYYILSYLHIHFYPRRIQVNNLNENDYVGTKRMYSRETIINSKGNRFAECKDIK